ncbi:MAG TPA: DUF1553 domain-containing protein [Verrucomicrobiae bacterium]|nr:DUF1553 domain-containing protein [Verrucomicrobiae bacterium]
MNLRWQLRPGLLRLPAAAILLLLALGPAAHSAGAAPGRDSRIDFNFHIRPLFSDRCFTCHGPDEKSRKGKLRLDTREGIFKSLGDGSAVVTPRNLAKSELFRRITTTDPDEMMPPPKSHLAISPQEVALIRRWIEQGAEWKGHWAFQPLSDVEVPAVRNAKWVRNDLDRFILSRLEKERLKPQREADKERLIRRVTFDLTGLPPTLKEVDDFVGDRTAGAYERVVDRLLASATYGERMAVDWLDVARYSDTHGYQSDRPNYMWPWRDFVISAFNRNVRINQFIIWQIAGDLLPGATREQKLATAFNRNHRQTNEGGSVNEEFRVEYVADRLHTMAGAFLGLTMECARCHDHKYDPVSQKDYYRMFAFFNATDESGLYSHFTDAIPSPSLLLFKDDAQEQAHRDLKSAVVAAEQALQARRDSARGAFQEWRKNAPDGPRDSALAGLVGHYSFDSVVSNRVTNLAGTNGTAKLADSPASVPGRMGQALKFTGENSVGIEKVADFKRTDPFSFGLWLKIPEELDEIVVLHHQQAGSDAAYNGYQLVLENGRAAFGLIHFWPGNALQVRTTEKLKLNEWLHLGVTYDGSSRASGLKMYLNGSPAGVEVVRDQLFKESGNGVALTLAARFRGRGFKDGLVDDLKIFNRELTALEMAQVSGSPSGDLAANDEVLFAYFLANADDGWRKARAEVQRAREKENEFINRVTEIMTLGDRREGRTTHVLKRGAYDAPGETVEPDTPEAILSMDPAWPRNRLGLAQWLVSQRQPLTARVWVNRSWQMFFGRGLVQTAENFGLQGTLPSHPELLDWLARQFTETGWDQKALCKLVVMSATYRQSSVASPDMLARDPENVLLARGPRNRLTAEMLRDNALAASGLLVRTLGGPSVKPYQPEGVWEDTAGAKYEADKGAGLYRRSLYTYWKRTAPHPAMVTFDAAERNNCTVRRQSTSTPLQALVLLNDPQFVEAARKLGERAIKEGGSQVDDQVAFVFRTLTGRHPSAKERTILRRLHDEQLVLFQANTNRAEALAKVGAAAPDKTLSAGEAAAFASVANAVMSFDETIVKR